MKKLTKILVFMLLILIVTLNFNTYAAVEVTKENLKLALEEIIDEDGKLKEGENSFIIYDDEYSFEFKYDLSQKNPKFYTESIIEKGMTLTEYSGESTNNVILAYVYAAIAHLQGVDAGSAAQYMSFSILEVIEKDNILASDIYKVVDDSHIIEEENKDKIIKKSEFGNRVIELVDATFKERVVEDQLKTVTATVKKEDTSETSRKIITEIVINMDSDFSKIEETLQQIKDELLKEWEDTLDDEENNVNDGLKYEQEEKKPEKEISKIPYAGLEFSKVAYVVSINIVALIIVLFRVILRSERKKNRK